MSKIIDGSEILGGMIIIYDDDKMLLVAEILKKNKSQSKLKITVMWSHD